MGKHKDLTLKDKILLIPLVEISISLRNTALTIRSYEREFICSDYLLSDNSIRLELLQIFYYLGSFLKNQ